MQLQGSRQAGGARARALREERVGLFPTLFTRRPSPGAWGCRPASFSDGRRATRDLTGAMRPLSPGSSASASRSCGDRGPRSGAVAAGSASRRGVARLLGALGVVSGILTAALLGLDPTLLPAAELTRFAVPILLPPVSGGVDVLHETVS